MIINSGDVEPRIIDDYDFLFVNGVAWPVTLDTTAGDSISFSDDIVTVSIKGRPSPGDMGFISPDETQTIFKSNLILINHRRRLAVPQTPEQRNQVQELIQHKVGKSIH